LFQLRRFFWCVWRLFVILEKYLSNRNGGNPFLSDFQIYSTIHLQTLIEIGKVTKHVLSWKTRFRILSNFAKRTSLCSKKNWQCYDGTFFIAAKCKSTNFIIFFVTLLVGYMKGWQMGTTYFPVFYERW
jgi:hypothetical protein